MEGKVSPSFKQEKYEWLRECCSLDLMELDEEVMRIPVLIQEAAECTAQANERRETAKSDLEHTMADVAQVLREDRVSGKQRSETAIASSIPLYKEYSEKLTALSNARLDAALWASVMESLRSKSMNIRVAADLINSGFMTQDFIRNKRRREIREAIPTETKV